MKLAYSGGGAVGSPGWGRSTEKVLGVTRKCENQTYSWMKTISRIIKTRTRVISSCHWVNFQFSFWFDFIVFWGRWWINYEKLIREIDPGSEKKNSGKSVSFLFEWCSSAVVPLFRRLHLQLTLSFFGFRYTQFYLTA